MSSCPGVRIATHGQDLDSCPSLPQGDQNAHAQVGSSGAQQASRSARNVTRMDTVLQVAVNSLALAATYLLVALGLALLLGGLDIPQLALGKVSYLACIVTFSVMASVPVGLALLWGVLTGTCVSLVLYVGIFRPLSRRGDQLDMLLVAFGLTILISNLGVALFGSNPRTLQLELDHGFDVGPVRFTLLQVVVVVVTVLLWVALTLALRRSTWGIRIRAMGEDPGTSALLGVPVTRVGLWAFGIAGALAATGGLLWASLYSSYPEADISPTIIAFVAVVVGGAGSMVGVAGACAGIAVIQSAAGSIGFSGWQTSIVYGALIAILLVRPYGVVDSSARRV
jgi:branched-chain amino acid transport system permease protein